MMQGAIWILNISRITQLVQTRLNEKRLPICKGGLFIFLILRYPQRQHTKYSISLHVSLSVINTHGGLAGIGASGQLLRVKMALLGTVAWHAVSHAAGLQFGGSRPLLTPPVALRINPNPSTLPSLPHSHAALQASRQTRAGWVKTRRERDSVYKFHLNTETIFRTPGVQGSMLEYCSKLLLLFFTVRHCDFDLLVFFLIISTTCSGCLQKVTLCLLFFYIHTMEWQASLDAEWVVRWKPHSEQWWAACTVMIMRLVFMLQDELLRNYNNNGY